MVALNEEINLSKIGKDQSKLHLITDMNRYGATLFMTRLEYENFSPRSDDNKLFEMTIVKWPLDSFEMLWAVISVPITFNSVVKKLAEELHLKISDGVPNLTSNDKILEFPLKGPTVYTLEYSSSNPIFQNPDEFHKLKSEELLLAEKIIKEDRRIFIDELKAHGWSDQEIEKYLEKADQDLENQYQSIRSL